MKICVVVLLFQNTNVWLLKRLLISEYLHPDAEFSEFIYEVSFKVPSILKSGIVISSVENDPSGIPVFSRCRLPVCVWHLWSEGVRYGFLLLFTNIRQVSLSYAVCYFCPLKFSVCVHNTCIAVFGGQCKYVMIRCINFEILVGI